MRFIPFLVFVLILFQLVLTQAQTTQGAQHQIQQAVVEMKKQIADMEKQIVEAKKNKEDAETIKQMETELVIFKKQLENIEEASKDISNISENPIQQTSHQTTMNSVPKRDVNRINILPKKTLSDIELVTFIQKVHTAIDKKLSVSQKNNAKALYDEINIKSKSPGVTGNIAVLSWMAGSTDMAIWILGKACIDDMANTDNLANYASFLSMVGGEHLAIPILQNLETKFPGNTTLLNNLGQAWYGLGEMNNAKKYLDSTVHLIAAHPYANETNSEIDESEGKNKESIESLKRSIKEEYTPEKESRLNKLGVTLKYDDIDEPECSRAAGTAGKAKTLGIEKFLNTIPDYPMEGGLNADLIHMTWYDYKEKLSAAQGKLKDEIEQLQKAAKAHEMKIVKDPTLLYPFNNRQYKTAKRKLDLLIEWESERIVALSKKMYAAGDTIEKWRNDYNKSKNKVADCEPQLALATSFNMKANTLWHLRNNESLDFQKEYLNALARLSLCATTDRSLYELNIATIKSSFLSSLGGLNCEFEVGCGKSETDKKPAGKILPDFDEMNCQYKTELSIPYAEKYFSIKVECNKMTTKFDVKYVKGSLEENLANGKYKGTVEVQGKIGKDMMPLGPIDYIEHVLNPVGPDGPFQVGTEIKAGAGVDFTEGGIQDVYVTGKVSVKAGLTGIDAPVPSSVSISSLEGRMSVITGQGSISGKGAFSGISIK
jgi:hypothetical protein